MEKKLFMITTIPKMRKLFKQSISQIKSAQAFLQKRWTTKSEIYPKIAIIDSLPSIDSTLQQQKLIEMKSLLQEKDLNLREKDSKYLISIVCEDYFKEMMDEYLRKVLISGRVVPLKQYQQQQQIKQQVIALYWRFFYGDPLSELEYEIEHKYVVLKQRKFLKYQNTQKESDKCVWLMSQQQRTQVMTNWQHRVNEFFDDQKPIYDPLKISRKLRVIELSQEIEQYRWYKKLFYYLFERKRFVKSRKRSEWITQYLFTRSLLYLSSHEFQDAMNIPADFHIEHSLVNIQSWMMIDRLRKINTPESKFTGRFMELMIKKWMEEEVGRIHLRKKNEFARDIESYMRVSNGYLDYHFNKNSATVKNNYYKLDALVWSIVYFEKVPRYSDEVFKMAEYLKVNYDYIQTLDFEKFEDCDIQFDVLKIGLDYKEKLLSVNPPMNEREFLEELYSDNKKKRYYYSYHEEIEMEDMQYDQEIRRSVFNLRLGEYGK